MQITIESPGIKISQKLQRQIEAKFKHLETLYDRIVNCDILLKKEKNDRQKSCCIEARLLVPKELLFASEREESFEIALDKLVDDLQHQLRRHKEAMEEAR